MDTSRPVTVFFGRGAYAPSQATVDLGKAGLLSGATGLGGLLLAGFLHSYALAETIEGHVIGISDGDTITVLDQDHNQIKVRLGGIDAPEKKQAFGDRSKQHLSSLVFDKDVLVEWHKRDKYPFKVSGVQGRRSIRWFFGPEREPVWATIVRRLPGLAIEALSAAFESCSVIFDDGYFTAPIPRWVQRVDFLTAPVETFPKLLSLGGDPNEPDQYGISPLDYAINIERPERAIALIEAGAFFESYGPDGWQRHKLEGMPEVIAAMEAAHLRQVTAMAFAEKRASLRL